jgi:hypothetical protein
VIETPRNGALGTRKKAPVFAISLRRNITIPALGGPPASLRPGLRTVCRASRSFGAAPPADPQSTHGKTRIKESPDRAGSYKKPKFAQNARASRLRPGASAPTHERPFALIAMTNAAPLTHPRNRSPHSLVACLGHRPARYLVLFFRRLRNGPVGIAYASGTTLAQKLF